MGGIDWMSFALCFLVCVAMATLIVASAARVLRRMLGSRWLTAVIGALIGYRIPPVQRSDDGIIDRVSAVIRRR